jgi:hypothetical protein
MFDILIHVRVASALANWIWFIPSPSFIEPLAPCTSLHLIVELPILTSISTILISLFTQGICISSSAPGRQTPVIAGSTGSAEIDWSKYLSKYWSKYWSKRSKMLVKNAERDCWVHRICGD